MDIDNCYFFVDKQLEVDALPGTKSKREGIRARSRSMVNGVRKLTRLHSFSGSVPRYVPESTKITD